MGAWGIKVLNNDEVLDGMDWIIDCKMENLPFITELLLLSNDEMYKTLGVVIIACTKVMPRIDMLTEGNAADYDGFFNRIYIETQNNAKFKADMEFYSGYVYEAIKDLEENIENWSSDSKEKRKEYIKMLKEIIINDKEENK